MSETAGPYETVKDAAAAAADVYAKPPGPAWTEGNLGLLLDACRAAGVQLGAHDHRILAWLAGYEPSTCAVVARLINPSEREIVAPEPKNSGGHEDL